LKPPREFKMNVLFLVSNYPEENNTNGIFYKRMAEALFNRQVSVTVLVSTPYSNWLLSLFSPKWKMYYKKQIFHPSYNIAIVNGVTVIRYFYLAMPNERKYGFPVFLMKNSLKRLFDKIKFDFDIIDANCAYPYGQVGAYLSHKYDVPNIVTIRGSDINDFPLEGKTEMKRTIKSLTNCDRIVTVGKDLEKNVNLIYPNRRTYTIPVGLDLSNSELINKLALPELKNSYKIGEKFNIIFVGSLEHLKGFDLILNILEKTKSEKNIHWNIVGHGTYERELLKFENATWFGSQKNEDTLKLIKCCDLMVLPSRSEGMPNVLKEAGSLGIPIVASNVGEIPYFLDNGLRGGIFESNSEEKLLKAIRSTIKNYSEAKQKALNLQKYVFDVYDIKKSSQNLLNLYNSVLA
jgi:teichuronic acid biosynthesis glycosyltransferase TuaC